MSVFYSPSRQSVIDAFSISLFSRDGSKIVHLRAAFPAGQPPPEEVFVIVVEKEKGREEKGGKKSADTSSTVPQTTLWWHG